LRGIKWGRIEEQPRKKRGVTTIGTPKKTGDLVSHTGEKRSEGNERIPRGTNTSRSVKSRRWHKSKARRARTGKCKGGEK